MASEKRGLETTVNTLWLSLHFREFEQSCNRSSSKIIRKFPRAVKLHHFLDYSNWSTIWITFIETTITIVWYSIKTLYPNKSWILQSITTEWSPPPPQCSPKCPLKCCCRVESGKLFCWQISFHQWKSTLGPRQWIYKWKQRCKEISTHHIPLDVSTDYFH